MTAPRRALVVVDVQREYVDGPLAIQYPPVDESLANITRVIQAAADQGLPIVIVQHSLPEGAPIFVAGTSGFELHPAVERLVDPSWKRVVKQYGSVFADTDVAAWLKDQGVDTVTFAGYMTNNCDLASAVEAEGLGFTAEILSDATGAIHLANSAGAVSAEKVHTTLMVLLNSNFAAVLSTDEWLEALRSGVEAARSNLVESALEGRQRA